jgi:hypothetical protein
MKIVDDLKSDTTASVVAEYVDSGAELTTDAYTSYATSKVVSTMFENIPLVWRGQGVVDN